jgi:purine-binding chemotaxis protein CheW
MEAPVSDAVSQVLTFKLDQEIFAVDVGRIREVLELTAMTKLPGTPDFVRGVLNLRGDVVPVVDLRMKLGLGMTDKTVDTCVVISEIALDGQRVVVGVLVDSVQEVIDIDGKSLVPPPRMGNRIDASAIRGMARRDDHFIMILDLDRVFSGHELQATAESQETTLPSMEAAP